MPIDSISIGGVQDFGEFNQTNNCPSYSGRGRELHDQRHLRSAVSRERRPIRFSPPIFGTGNVVGLRG